MSSSDMFSITAKTGAGFMPVSPEASGSRPLNVDLGAGGCASPPNFYEQNKLGGDDGMNNRTSNTEDFTGNDLKLSLHVLTLDQEGYVKETSRQTIDYPNGTPILQRGDILVSEKVFDHVESQMDEFCRVRYVNGDIVSEYKPNLVLKERVDRWVENRKSGSVGVELDSRYEMFWFTSSDISDLALACSLSYPFLLEDEAGTLANLSTSSVKTLSAKVLERRGLLVRLLHETRREAKTATTLNQLNELLKDADNELENLQWYRV